MYLYPLNYLLLCFTLLFQFSFATLSAEETLYKGKNSEHLSSNYNASKIKNRLKILNKKITKEQKIIKKLFYQYTEAHPDVQFHKNLLKDYSLERDYLKKLQNKNYKYTKKDKKNLDRISKESKSSKTTYQATKLKDSGALIKNNHKQKNKYFSLKINTDPNITNNYYSKRNLKLPITNTETGARVSKGSSPKIIPLPQNCYFKTSDLKFTNKNKHKHTTNVPLRIPLYVSERSGVNRTNTIISGGVPFPIGSVSDLSQYQVVDNQNNPVATQLSPMVLWHAPAYDNSIQWGLVSFSASVKANSTNTYYLVKQDNQTNTINPIQLIEHTDKFIINVAGAEYVVPKSGNSLISQASYKNKLLISGNGLQATIKSGSWPERELFNGQRHIGEHTKVVVEESGELRTVLAIQGKYTPGDTQQIYYTFKARLYFEANNPQVKIVFTISNSTLDPTLYPQPDGNMQRFVYQWPIEDASLEADLAFSDLAAVKTLTADGVVTGSNLHVYQDSSGGEQWKNLTKTNYTQWLSKYTNGETVKGVQFKGYQIYDGQTLVKQGNYARGISTVQDSTYGLSASMRNFRVQYPSAIDVSSSKLRLGLFPEEFSEPFHLNIGQQKSWEMQLAFYDLINEPNISDSYKKQDTRLLFRPDPECMIEASRNGAWPNGMALISPKSKYYTPKEKLDKDSLDGIVTGWDWNGWIALQSSNSFF